MSTTPSSEKTVSKLFCDPDANVVFQSCDGVKFHIHRKYLETNTQGFPPAGIETHGEVVVLTETASILELLFQYIYPRRHPNLLDINFEDLTALSEAAEKYEVFSAMVVCEIRMRAAAAVSNHAPEVLNYAAKHGHPDILDEAALHVIKLSLGEIMPRLTPILTGPWTMYYAHWLDVLALVSAVPQGTSALAHPHEFCSLKPSAYRRSPLPTDCDDWALVVCVVLSRIAGRVSSLIDLSTGFQNLPSHDCIFVDDHIKEWVTMAETAVANIPKFHTFV